LKQDAQAKAKAQEAINRKQQGQIDSLDTKLKDESRERLAAQTKATKLNGELKVEKKLVKTTKKELEQKLETQKKESEKTIKSEQEENKKLNAKAHSLTASVHTLTGERDKARTEVRDLKARYSKLVSGMKSVSMIASEHDEDESVVSTPPVPSKASSKKDN